MEVIARKGMQAEPATPASAPAESALAAFIDELSHGVLIAGADGKLVHANVAGRQALARGDALLLTTNARIHAMHLESDAALQLAFGRSLAGRRSLVPLGSQKGGSPAVAVVPLRHTANEAARCAVVLPRSTLCDTLMLGFFAREHRLTPTEEQVLRVLCEGVLAPQAARRMGVAVSTVRSHVRSICSKTRARSVRELMRAMAVLPPLALPPAPARLQAVSAAHPSC